MARQSAARSALVVERDTDSAPRPGFSPPGPPAGVGAGVLALVDTLRDVRQSRARAEAARAASASASAPCATPEDLARAIVEGDCGAVHSHAMDLHLNSDSLRVRGRRVVEEAIDRKMDHMAAVIMLLGGSFLLPDGDNLVRRARSAGLADLAELWLSLYPALRELPA